MLMIVKTIIIWDPTKEIEEFYKYTKDKKYTRVYRSTNAIITENEKIITIEEESENE